MILRADHVAGAAFIGFGLLVFALSGDLPMGRLSMPGAGFMPSLVATLLIVFGAALFARAGDSTPFSQLSWDDLSHAALVIAVTACAIALYTAAGFLITVAGMLFVFLTLVERKPVLRAAMFSVACTLLTYTLFGTVLRSPLPTGPFNF